MKMRSWYSQFYSQDSLYAKKMAVEQEALKEAGAVHVSYVAYFKHL